MDLRKNKADATLVFLVRGTGGKKKTLLAKKVRKIGIGRYNGFGGSMNNKEAPRACAIRELKKESGYVGLKKDLEFVGIVTFHNKRRKRPDFIVKVFVFILKKWAGRRNLKKDEMINPKWFKTHRLPLKQMMAGDKKFVHQILSGNHGDKLLRGEFWYAEEQKKLLEFEVRWVARTGDVD